MRMSSVPFAVQAAEGSACKRRIAPRLWACGVARHFLQQSFAAVYAARRFKKGPLPECFNAETSLSLTVFHNYVGASPLNSLPFLPYSPSHIPQSVTNETTSRAPK